MASLKNRIVRLERSLSPLEQMSTKHYKYTWNDWTDEELHLAVKHFSSGTAPPPELKEKILHTAPSGRLAGLTEEEKEKAWRQLMAAAHETGDEND